MKHRIWWNTITLGLLLIAFPIVAFSTEVKPPIASTQIDNGELAAFFDSFMAEELAELNISGAAVVIVLDGEIILSMGYGFSDLDSETPVNPSETVFRVGSVSKLFAATAVMQLVERGEVDLHTDVNQYLTAFQIPATFPEPVTLHHLLTHTAGFEDQFIGVTTENEDEFGSLEDFLKDAMPARVTPPGEIHSYNNYGYTLAGYIVEEVSGIPFEEYIDRYIFQPLGMTLSSFAQPLPPTLEAHLATGYELADDNLTPANFEYNRVVPAGALSITAEDIATFMIAHLHSGDTEILDEATADLMHEQQFTHHPELPGMTYGFKERTINGRRVIGHGGDIFAYSSQMILVPEDNLGFFIAYNAFSDAFREDLIAAFFDQFYPQTTVETPPTILNLSQSELQRFAGTYRWVKYNDSTIGKVLALLPQYNLIVRANDDGTLLLKLPGLASGWRFAPTDPLVFKQIEGEPVEVGGLTIDPGETLVFREAQDGEITYAFIGLQNVAAKKLAWYEGGEGTYAIMATTSLIFLVIFIILLVGAGINRLRKRTEEVYYISRTLWWTTLAISGLNVVFVVAMFLTFGEQLRFGIPTEYYVLLAIPMLTALLTLVLLGGTFLSWVRGYGSILGKMAYSVIVINSMVFIWWLNYWNLLGYQF